MSILLRFKLFLYGVMAVMLMAGLYRFFVRTIPFYKEFRDYYVRDGEYYFMTGTLLLEGSNPYPDPVNDRAVGTLYPPLGPLLYTIAWRMAGQEKWAPRAISLACLLSISVLVLHRLWRQGACLLGTAAAGFWLMIQPLFHDLLLAIQADSLTIVLIAAGIIQGERYLRDDRGLAAISLLASLALLVKPQGLLIPGSLICTLLARRDFKKILRLILAVSVLVTMVFGSLHLWSGGWSTRMFMVAWCEMYFASGYIEGCRDLFLSPPGLVLTLVGLAGIGFLRISPWVFAWLLSIPMGLSGMAKIGGYYNSLSYPCFFATVVSFLGLHAAAARTWPDCLRHLPLISRTCAPSLLLLTALIMDRSSVIEHIPASCQWQQDVISLVRKEPGEVITLENPSVVIMAGRSVSDQINIAAEVEMCGFPALTRILNDLRRGRYSILVTATNNWDYYIAAARSGGREDFAQTLEELSRIIQTDFRMVADYPLPLADIYRYCGTAPGN